MKYADEWRCFPDSQKISLPSVKFLIGMIGTSNERLFMTVLIIIYEYIPPPCYKENYIVKLSSELRKTVHEWSRPRVVFDENLYVNNYWDLIGRYNYTLNRYAYLYPSTRYSNIHLPILPSHVLYACIAKLPGSCQMCETDGVDPRLQLR